MLLAIDVGNTNIVIGIYDKNKFIGFSRVATSYSRTADEICIMLQYTLDKYAVDKEQIEGIIVSSVVPPVMYSLLHAIRFYFDIEPMVVSRELDIGMSIKIDNPHELGVDNITNALAAIELYGGNLIVVDFGTATTFSAINDKREYLGGAICAGIRVSIDALAGKTAKLPWIELARPVKVIGTNTIDSMQAGAVYGYAGQVDAIVTRMKKELGGTATVIATGGLSSLIAPETETIKTINRQLTLEGLRYMYERNKGVIS